MRDGWTFLEQGDEGIEEVLACAPLEARDLSLWVRVKMDEHGLRKNEVVRRSQLNQTFAYQIIAGSRNASRDKLIQLAFGLCFGVDETCDLLERGGLSALLPTGRRDVVIAWCLHHGVGLSSCDDLLWDLGEHTLMPEDRHERPDM